MLLVKLSLPAGAVVFCQSMFGAAFNKALTDSGDCCCADVKG